MKRDIKLIVTDLDGTFLDDEKNIPQINIDAVRACKEAGIHICPASARNWPSLEDIAQEAGMTEYCLICNGVAILDAATQEVQYRNRVAPQAVEPLARIAMKYGSRVQVMGTHRMIAMSSMVKHGPHMHGGKVVRMRGRRMLHQVDTFEEFIEAAKDDCNVLFVWLDHKDHLPMYTEMCEVGDFELSAADEDHVYVMARDATKGKACEILAGLYGIRPDQVMAFGDGKNDIPMLRWAGIGVAMENAMEQTKDAADYVTCTNNEGGVGKAIFRLIFGEER
ncbi:MAG: hypothetical protein DBY42_07150 [Bacillota bacterium]|nr:MAG: hypothetical protein DBY42_07150 [Bacillota bacterium]